jgi:O-antigen/teichoic acid export membrane protein
MENALSLTSKIDMIIIGAAVVGALVAARPLVELMTGGKYGAMAYAIPWLLLYVVTIPIYKSFEIVAVLVGATSTLAVTFIISLFWGILTYFLSLRFGVLALLVCPLGDALMRISYLYIMLRRRGVHNAVDAPMLTLLIVGVGVAGLVGMQVVAVFTLGVVATIAVGVLMAVLYLLALFLIRPLRLGEVALLVGDIANGAWTNYAKRLARP